MSVLVDAHVHFHPRFSARSFLDAAQRNLLYAARRLGASARSQCLLLLADPPGWDSFAALLRSPTSDTAGWTLEKSSDGVTMRAQGSENAGLILLRGRQLQSDDRLEVLAFGGPGELPSGSPFHDTVRRAVDLGAVTVLPWGFGKWGGARGRRVAAVIEGVHSDMLFVGDSGARLTGTPEPRLVRRAARYGLYNLPGTDPFPFPAHQERAGSRGFVLDGELDPDRPADSFRRLLAGLTAQPRTFGSGMSPLRFAISQTRMQLARRTA